MTQLSADNHLAKSQQKSSSVLTNKAKSYGISSKSFYGNGATRPRGQIPYFFCGQAVRSPSDSNGQEEKLWPKLRHRNSPAGGKWKRLDGRFHSSKSLSSPLTAELQREPLRTSLSSPLNKQHISPAPRFGLAQDCRARRALTYLPTDTESEFQTEDESNKENRSQVDISKLIDCLDRDMEMEDYKAEEETAPEPEPPPEPPQQIIQAQDIGFPNPPGTNRCWINATLQMLLGMDVFIEQLEQSCWRDERSSQSTVLRTFFDVVRLRRYGRRLALHCALRRLSVSLGALDPMFMSNTQQDATEFLVRLLDLFREQFSTSERCTLRELQLDNLPEGDGPSVQRAGDDNPVSENFEFRLKETYSCDSCNETSSKTQDHLALFLDVPPTSSVRPSLQEALCRYMQPDVRELKCVRCSGQRTRVQTAFTKLPRFLLVQVKRYAVQTAIAEKLTDLLRVPITLSVKNFVSGDVVMPALWSPGNNYPQEEVPVEEEEERELQEAMRQSLQEEDEELEQAIQLSLQEQRLATAMQDSDLSMGEDFSFEGDEDSPSDLTYRLISVIMHQGLSPNCGHYVADVYNVQQHQWYHYDDESVSHPTEDEVLGKIRQRNGYVFCYMHKALFDELSQQQA